MKIIDIHAHLGQDLFGTSDSNLDVYIDGARKIGITKTIFIPTPTCLINKLDGTYAGCLWKKDPGGKINYYILNNNKINKNPSNPYKIINNYIYSIIKYANQKNNIRFYFSPIVHPILDEPEIFKKYLTLKDTKAIKVHGVATYTSPKDMPKWIIEFSKKYNKPLIIHTDFCQYKKTYTDLENAYLKNIPRDWVIWASENNVKVNFAHGLRGDSKAINLANKCENITVGISPDLLLKSEPKRLSTKEDYLEYILNNIDENKLMFDTDFSWNIKKRGEWNKLDWGLPKRISKIYKLLGKNTAKVFHKNAERFFNLS